MVSSLLVEPVAPIGSPSCFHLVGETHSCPVQRSFTDQALAVRLSMFLHIVAGKEEVYAKEEIISGLREGPLARPALKSLGASADALSLITASAFSIPDYLFWIIGAAAFIYLLYIQDTWAQKRARGKIYAILGGRFSSAELERLIKEYGAGHIARTITNPEYMPLVEKFGFKIFFKLEENWPRGGFFYDFPLVAYRIESREQLHNVPKLIGNLEKIAGEIWIDRNAHLSYGTYASSTDRELESLEKLIEILKKVTFQPEEIDDPFGSNSSSDNPSDPQRGISPWGLMAGLGTTLAAARIGPAIIPVISAIPPWVWGGGGIILALVLVSILMKRSDARELKFEDEISRVWYETGDGFRLFQNEDENFEPESSDYLDSRALGRKIALALEAQGLSSESLYRTFRDYVLSVPKASTHVVWYAAAAGGQLASVTYPDPRQLLPILQMLSDPRRTHHPLMANPQEAA